MAVLGSGLQSHKIIENYFRKAIPVQTYLDRSQIACRNLSDKMCRIQEAIDGYFWAQHLCCSITQEMHETIELIENCVQEKFNELNRELESAQDERIGEVLQKYYPYDLHIQEQEKGIFFHFLKSYFSSEFLMRTYQDTVTSQKMSSEAFLVQIKRTKKDALEAILQSGCVKIEFSENGSKSSLGVNKLAMIRLKDLSAFFYSSVSYS